MEINYRCSSLLFTILFLYCCWCDAVLSPVTINNEPITNNSSSFNKVTTGSRTFTIDRGPCNCFRKDGQEYRYASGSMHYFRVPRAYWADRMKKFQAAGLNAIETYVAWNVHEPFKGHFDFDGQNDLFAYLSTAQNHSLDVILRTGPYIDAEWDFGGLPFWLLNINSSMALRTRDQQFMQNVEDWFSYLLPKLKPYLYINGGNIISIQVENEYGSLGICDDVYKNTIRDSIYKHLDTKDIVLFSTDGNSRQLVKCGRVDGAHATIDFGPGDNATADFLQNLRPLEPTGPAINSEFYPGWLDWWGNTFQKRPAKSVSMSFDDILSTESSSCANIYVFHGATSWGFFAGANIDNGKYWPGITSYDYDAPLTEAGDTTEKYMLIRDVVKKHFNRAMPDVPLNSTKTAYSDVQMIPTATLFENLSVFAEIGKIQVEGVPLTFEQIMQDYGFILYRHVFDRDYKHGRLNVTGLRDRAIVFVDRNRIGVLSRQDNELIMELGPIDAGQQLDILLENQGRVCFGRQLNDPKGLNVLYPLLIDGYEPTNWTMFPIPLNTSSWVSRDTAELSPLVDVGEYDIPARYEGSFMVEKRSSSDESPDDTFLLLNATFAKGVAFINGHNLGRYWPDRGPQITLYVPGVYLNVAPMMNTLVLFELDRAKCDDSSECLASFSAKPTLDAPVSATRIEQRQLELFKFAALPRS